MEKRLSIKEHISVQEIEKLYRGARDVVERSQWQIIWLLAKGSKSETDNLEIPPGLFLEFLPAYSPELHL